MDRRFTFMSSGGCLPLPLGYIHVYDHAPCYSKFFLSEIAWPNEAELHVEHP